MPVRSGQFENRQPLSGRPLIARPTGVGLKGVWGILCAYNLSGAVSGRSCLVTHAHGRTKERRRTTVHGPQHPKVHAPAAVYIARALRECLPRAPPRHAACRHAAATTIGRLYNARRSAHPTAQLTLPN